MGIDVSTRAGALRFAELRREEMRRQYLSDGRLAKNPLIYIFATHSFRANIGAETVETAVRTGARLARVTAIPCPLPDDVRAKLGPTSMTRVYGKVIRIAARAAKAVGVLVTMDGWFADASQAPDDHHYGWVEENKDGEGLLMLLEHKALAHPMSWTSTIRREPLRLDPWRGGEQTKSEETRLSHFIDWSS
jgi:hypothetical protein